MNLKYFILVAIFLSMIIVGCIDNSSDDVKIEKSPEDKFDDLFINYYAKPRIVSVSNYSGAVEECNLLKNDVINKSNVFLQLANEWDNNWNNNWESATYSGELSKQEQKDIRTLSKKVSNANDDFFSSIVLYGSFVVTYNDKLSENGIKYEDELSWISYVREPINSKMDPISINSAMIEYAYG